MRFEAAERLRTQAHSSALGITRHEPAQLAVAAAVDAPAAQVAWSSFVPFLAHPVMAPGAREAMKLIEQAGTKPRAVAG